MICHLEEERCLSKERGPSNCLLIDRSVSQIEASLIPQARQAFQTRRVPSLIPDSKTKAYYLYTRHFDTIATVIRIYESLEISLYTHNHNGRLQQDEECRA